MNYSLTILKLLICSCDKYAVLPVLPSFTHYYCYFIRHVPSKCTTSRVRVIYERYTSVTRNIRVSRLAYELLTRNLRATCERTSLVPLAKSFTSVWNSFMYSWTSWRALASACECVRVFTSSLRGSYEDHARVLRASWASDEFVGNSLASRS